jgi:uncharacterized protein
MDYPEKYNRLLQWFEKSRNIAVAFSGGVDSTFLLAVAQKVLGDKVIALTVKSPYIPDWEIAEAVLFCKKNRIRHRIIHTDILDSIRNNPVNRCYLCKHHVFTLLKNQADLHGFSILIDGTNADDSGMYRPGLAALHELGIKSPLLENNISKAEVRQYSGMMELPTAGKPAYACLLTRLPYDYQVKEEELRRIEKAEVYLASVGLANSRVRNHGNMARIEMEKDKIPAFTGSEEATRMVSYFKELGYLYITIDLEGYRSGSFDKGLK